MKNLALSIALVSSGAFAQVTKNVGDFDEVKVFDRISVELIPSGENKVEINGSRSNDVEIVNRNGELKIRMKVEKLLDGEDIDAKVHYTAIKGVEANEGSFISSSRKISQNSFDINSKEGSEVKLDLDVTELEVRAVTGGIVRLTGNAEEMEVTIGTGGILYAKDLQTSETEVDIKAGGTAEVNASDLVDADVKAGGNVRIFGKPKQIKKNTALGGSITEER